MVVRLQESEDGCSALGDFVRGRVDVLGGRCSERKLQFFHQDPRELCLVGIQHSLMVSTLDIPDKPYKWIELEIVRVL